MWQDLGITRQEWDQTPQAVRSVLLALQQQVRLMGIRFTAYEKQLADLREQVAAVDDLKAEIAELKERLGQNSTNSSKSPSSDPPSYKSPPERESKGRKRGGQPGHQGSTRKLLPEEEVDHIVELRPAACSGCGHKLRGADAQPERHQVAEVPPVRVEVTEYRRHALRCASCGVMTRAEWPAEVARTATGPRAQAIVGYLTGRLGASHRDGQHRLQRQHHDGADPAGKDQQKETDALGRVTKIVEDPGGLGFVTKYSYDAMDHLLIVNQGEQTRTYAYDSLGRLKSATNPENGTITCEYDGNGNVKKRTDERKISPTSQINVAVTFTYDEMNRIKSRSYNDGTPNVAYIYDNEPLPAGYPAASIYTRGASTGRLVAVTYGGTSAGNYFGYDQLGRIIKSVQQTGGTNYPLSYQYNLAGKVIAETSPSGRVVKTAYDGVGRLSSVAGDKNGVTKTYASGFGYNSQGALSTLKLGNGLWEHTTYDPQRLQVRVIGLSSSALDSSQLKLTYGYGVATANNGNVISQTIAAPALSLAQSFSYDELNRLKTAIEKKGASVQWQQSFSYDQYGNRQVITSGTTPALVNLNPTVSAADNRINSAGYQYDLAGNMTRDELDRTYQYDAENRLTGYGGATSAVYTYDGAGQRVMKVVVAGSLVATTTFVYDTGGDLVAEYATNAASSESGTRYLTMDRLGSTRIVTNGVIASGTQTVKARYDYMPFGEEIGSSYGNRSAVARYTMGESMRQKFTAYARDTESGLDFAQARYYANAQGRFTSADSVAGTTTNPQTLNRYAYTGNNPVNNVDPSGHAFFSAQFNGSEGTGFGYPDYTGGPTSEHIGRALDAYNERLKFTQDAMSVDSLRSYAVERKCSRKRA